MKIKVRTLYKRYVTYDYSKNGHYDYGMQWVVQEKALIFWHDITCFSEHEKAIEYMKKYKKRRELEETVFYDNGMEQ